MKNISCIRGTQGIQTLAFNFAFECRLLSSPACPRVVSPNRTHVLLLEVMVRVASGGVVYHWRKLPQVSFLSRQTRVCRDKSMLEATKLLSRQNVCHNKYLFVAIKMILVAAPANDKSCHKYHFYRDKDKNARRDKTFVATKYFCRDERRVCLDKTRLLSRQK